METRSLAIGLAVVVAAFAAVFGLAKATSSPTTPARAGAEVITPAAPSAIAGIDAGGAMPALRSNPGPSRQARAKRRTAARKTPSTGAPKSTPPKSTPTKPPTPAPSAPKPSAPAPSAPSKPAPAPKAPAKPQPKPVTGENID